MKLHSLNLASGLTTVSATPNKIKDYSTFCTVEANYWHTRSRQQSYL